MLTPAQAILSALLTAILVEFLTRRYGSGSNYETIPLESEIIKTITISNNLEIPSEPPAPPAAAEVNKLIDAIFVSHGIGIEPESTVENVTEATEIATAEIETENLNKTETLDDSAEAQNNEQIAPFLFPFLFPFPFPVLELDESNFNSLFTGNWLILSHFPFHTPSSLYHDHFITHFPSAIRSPHLKLATVDCNAHPMIAAALQVRHYPSLQMVTEEGRLREWPFELRKLDKKASWFLAKSQWSHLPVYQLLRPLDASLVLSAIQIALFNKVHRLGGKAQSIIYNWVLNHRPHTASILGLSFAALLFGRKARIL